MQRHTGDAAHRVSPVSDNGCKQAQPKPTDCCYVFYVVLIFWNCSFAIFCSFIVSKTFFLVSSLETYVMFSNFERYKKLFILCTLITTNQRWWDDILHRNVAGWVSGDSGGESINTIVVVIPAPRVAGSSSSYLRRHIVPVHLFSLRGSVTLSIDAYNVSYWP